MPTPWRAPRKARASARSWPTSTCITPSTSGWRSGGGAKQGGTSALSGMPTITCSSSRTGRMRSGCWPPCRTGSPSSGSACTKARPGWSSLDGGSCWLPGCWAGSYDQGGDERAEQGFAATACVVHILEEAEVVRQLFLRDTAMRAEPGAQQGPETLDGVDVHLAEAIAVLVASVFTLCVADCLVLIAPG